jgi:hypothetical protein
MDMKLLNFIQKYPTEKECVRYFRKVRELRGIKCDHCGSTAHSWDSEGEFFSCISCGNHIPLRSGTVLEDSRLPLKFWFLGIFLTTHPDRPYTYSDIMNKLDYLEAESISHMIDKLENIKKRIGNINDFDILLHSVAGGK